MITHPLWVQEVPGSNSGSGKGFYVLFFVVLLFLLFVQKHIVSQKFSIPFAMLIYLVYLPYCKIWLPIIRVWRYRPSIFKIHITLTYPLYWKTRTIECKYVLFWDLHQINIRYFALQYINNVRVFFYFLIKTFRQRFKGVALTIQYPSKISIHTLNIPVFG